MLIAKAGIERIVGVHLGRVHRFHEGYSPLAHTKAADE